MRGAPRRWTDRIEGDFMPRWMYGAAAMLFATMMIESPAQSAEPLQIRLGYVVASADAPFLIFEKGTTRHLGKSYAIAGTHFAGTPTIITALAAGEVDMAPFGYSTFALAIQNAKLTDLRVVADVFQDGVDGYYTNEYMVAKDSPIKTIADLKGKVLATNTAGSAVDMPLREMLQKHGLNPANDVSIIEVGFPNMRAVLEEHKVDLISIVLPFSANPKLRAGGRTLFTQKDAVGRSQMIVMVARRGFLDKNRAAVTDFLEDSLRQLHWYSDPANHVAAVKLVADYSKQPTALYDSWMFRKDGQKGDYYRDPHGLPDLDAMQANIDAQAKLGFLKSSPDVRKYAALGLIEEAAKRLK
jgi:sulfonate transport system substrate-binding protein